MLSPVLAAKIAAPFAPPPGIRRHGENQFRPGVVETDMQPGQLPAAIKGENQ
jgi:hypothetical protein